MRTTAAVAGIRRWHVVTALVAIVIVAAAAISAVSQRSSIANLETKNQTLTAAEARAIRQRDTTQQALDTARQDLDRRADQKAADDAEATRIEALRPPGATLFAANRASCHGRDGEGSIGPQLSDGTVAKHLTEPEAVAFVTGGGAPPMPTFGTVLSPSQIQQVVTYIRKL
jgi:mono/diheme cytochrome c family protein